MVLIDIAGFYCGTSNVVLPVPNKGHYPPEYQDKSRLNYYASMFNSVEVNSSFYKIPMGRTVEKWANDVPESFRFTFKLWKGITHNKELVFEEADIDRFIWAVDMAGTKKGCLLIQLPGSITVYYLPKLKGILDNIQARAADSWRLAIEFRHSSWYRDEIYQLLERYSASVVIHDMPKCPTPLIDMDTKFVYLRFHGEKGDYRGSYTDEFLEEYAAYIKDWIAEGKTVFAYFNNTMGKAVHNAISLAGY